MKEFLDRISTLSPQRLALLALEQHEQLERLKGAAREPIAIVGMACRFPGGADSPEALWEVLESGRDAVVPAPADRWELDRPVESIVDTEGRPKRMEGGFLNRVDLFDPLFFGISPREAETMDPQQRLLLEVAWEALEDAGLPPPELRGSRTGVFIGIAGNDFAQRMLAGKPENLDAYVATGGSHAVAGGRLAYTFHLNGPCLSIDTSCSASLVAVSVACDSLRLKRSELAIAGGVSLILSPETTLALAKGGLLSPDFRSRAFDARANGFARGEGCGLVVLKRLSDAERDGDRIWAVIRGTAVNQDGRSSGLTAPNGPAQQALLREALADAGIAPAQIQFVEAHGTGTSLGDPIEAQALGAVFGAGRAAGEPLLLGSIKANFGHLEAAAGIAGLMKLALSIHHGKIPPLLHLDSPNPHVDWTKLALALPTRLIPWPGERAARAGGVSSFGFSGTNAHLTLTSAPELADAPSASDRPEHLLCLSAQSEIGLRALTTRYVDFLGLHRELNAGDICYTAARGRMHHEHRLAVTGASSIQLRDHLNALVETSSFAHAATTPAPGVAFLFTGQGSQYPAMARELYRTHPGFRATLDRCDAVLRNVGQGLLEVLFSDHAEQAALVHQTGYAQPALFAVEYALAELLQSWGIRPGAVLGHSVGEYVAACVAGIFSLEDGLKFIAERGRLMQSLPAGGGMVVLLAEEKDVARALAPFSRTLSIAAFNGPSHLVVSGELSELDRFVESWDSQQLPFQRLAVSHAFHSALLDPILDGVERAAQSLTYHEPRCVVISNLTGQVASGSDLRSAGYWRRHTREPVRFAAGMQALYKAGYRTFVEIGPAPVLSGMARRFLKDPECRWLPLLQPARGDWESLLKSLGELYTGGAEIDWAAFDRGYARRKVSLPTYPFERKRYWPATEITPPARASDDEFRDWLYNIAWEPLPDSDGPGLGQSPARIKQAAGAHAERLYHELPPVDDDAFYRELDALCRNYILDAFAALGYRPGERDISTLGVVDRHRRLFERLLKILAEDGIDLSLPLAARTPPHLRLGELQAKYPGYAPELATLGACGPRLSEVLRGEVDPLPLLFPAGSLNLAARLYSETRPALLFNSLVAQCVRAALEATPATGTLRVLEIGAGTGGTTSRVLPYLPADRTSYWFTDISAQFLDQARHRFREHSFLEYRRFDLDRDPSEQGMEPGTFDLVIAANAIHATRDLRRSLARIRSLLKPEGLLLLLEVDRPQRFGDLTVGLTEGWWSFTDLDLRPDYPLLSRERWLELLEEGGFAHASSIPDVAPANPLAETGLFANQSVLLAGAPRRSEAALPRRWLLWTDSDAQGIGRHLAALLRDRGEECWIVLRGDRFEASDDGEFRISPGNPAEHLEVIRAFQAASRGSASMAVYLWGLDEGIDPDSSLASVSEAVEQRCQGALAAVQSILRAGGFGSVSLVTCGAHSEQDPRPSDAALWGFGGTVEAEHPELRSRRIDLQAGAESEELLRELLRDDRAIRQVALRDRTRSAPRMRRVEIQDASAVAVRIDPGACYLITGGLTGLGLESAGWLVDQGARHLVLAGRRPPGDLAQALIARWNQAGVQVACVQADIGDASGADRIFTALADGKVPLRGVIHSAGALDDAALLQQDWPRFERVLRAKVLGAWNLHQRTRTLELDFFALYSSAAAVLGSPGQANHAAANGFLDGLARWRRARNLPAVSINWGPWAETGAASGHGVIRRAERAGVGSIDTKGGLKALAYALSTRAPQVIVLPIDWQRLSDGGELFTGLSNAPRARIPAIGSPWFDKLQSAEPAARGAILRDMVGSEAARILSLESFHSIDPRHPLRELGLDSLMAIELRNVFSKGIGAELPATLLYNYPSVDQLVGHLAGYIAPSAAAEKEIGLDDLTEDDLARLLEEQIKLT